MGATTVAPSKHEKPPQVASLTSKLKSPAAHGAMY